MINFIGCPDSNFLKGRPFGLRPEAIVVHIIDGSFAAGESVFRDPSSHKSAHYAISRSGEIHQYVDEKDTAFHAGIVVNPSWPLLKPRINPNFYTIGIEHEGRPDDVWPEVQLSASATLIGEIAARWAIPIDDSHVIRHHQIRASKTCPGNWLQTSELLKRAPAVLGLAAASTGSVGSVAAVAAASSVGPVSPAPAASVTPATANVPVTASGSPIVVRTVANVKLRLARPTTAAPIVGVVLAGRELTVTKVETGESVAGNPNWYADGNGNFFWAGATNTPDPSVLAA